ncbi:ATP-binding protein [Myxococcota bacterium]|nr:ATP-binding protein [Myxococcota bacterium]
MLLALPRMADTMAEGAFVVRCGELVAELTDSASADVILVDASRGPASEAWGRVLRDREAVTYAEPLPGGAPGDVVHRALVPTLDAGAVVAIAELERATAGYGAEELETAELLVSALWRIVQRGRTEVALRVSEERLKLALAAADQGIYDLDLRTGDAVVTPEYARMLGYDPATFRETNAAWIERLHPDDRPRIEHFFREYVAGREPEYRVEFRQRTAGGAWRWILSLGRITERDADGHPTRMLGTHTDITSRKLAEEERRLAMASLAQADRLASMGMLAAGVAHEINNPLAFVLLSLDEMRLLGPEQHAELAAMIDKVHDGVLRIRDIVRGLKTFSHVDDGDLRPVHVEEAARHALEMAHNELKYRARIITDLAPTPAVAASRGKLAQVFLNLLLNAAHAIPEGHEETHEVEVRTWADETGVHASVSDTGCGMSVDVQRRIFEPFFTTKAVGVGSGLGLSICRNIIEDLGGRIDFTSLPGAGTTFHVRLPPAPRSSDEEPRPPTPPPDTPRARGRILVVDDEPALRASLERILGAQHEVHTAASGEDARSILREDQAFDVVFCDVMMPKLSGPELHAWAAANAPALASRFVFMTGGAFTPEAGRYLGRVPNKRIDKPFTLEALRREASELVQAARRRAG